MSEPLTIITPWHEHAELLAGYTQVVDFANVIIMDNGSSDPVASALREWSRGHEWSYVRDDGNAFFAAACNRGYRYALKAFDIAGDDVIMFLNNDVFGEEIGHDVIMDVSQPGVLYGMGRGTAMALDHAMAYLDGWCIAAQRATWEGLAGGDVGPWIEWPLPYHEDVELSWRALHRGMRLEVCNWPVQHMGNVTSRTVPGAYAGHGDNVARFQNIVRGAE